jgi:hypothetical protein
MPTPKSDFNENCPELTNKYENQASELPTFATRKKSENSHETFFKIIKKPLDYGANSATIFNTISLIKETWGN